MDLDPADVRNVVIGALYVLLAAALLRHLPRLGRAFPWFAALTAFFILRGIDRLYFGIFEREAPLISLLLDALLLVVVVLLILGIEKMGRGLRAVQDEARYRREEYERALADYRRLARHRLGNPLAAIRGGVLTLKDMPDLDPETEQELLDTVHEQVERLERIALDPELASEEEKQLRPRPDV